MSEASELTAKVSQIKILNNIDDTLAAAYPIPKGVAFSEDRDTCIIQKAVLYHRLRENPQLRKGEKNVTNDIRYRELADKIINGKDPVVEFIKGNKVEDQAQLLKEIIGSDQKKAWFETALVSAEEKMAEASVSAAGAKDGDIRKATAQRINSEKHTIQGDMLQRLVAQRTKTPREFLADKENMAAMKRMIAYKLHQSQIDYELEEFKKVIHYESKEKQDELLKERPPFSFEIAADENYDEHIKQLENSTEVTAMLRNMANAANLQELSKVISDPPSPGHLRRRDSFALMENKLIPDAVNTFLTGENKPEAGSKLEKLLKELSAMKEDDFPSEPTPEQCEKRVKEYKSILKELEKGKFFETKGGRELKEVLDGQIDRLQDVITQPDREKVEFNYRADTLIDYFDTNDPEQRPMDAIEAREKLIRGAELEQKTFVGDDFVGTSQKVSYDKKTGLINKGPEKLITRVVDLSDKAGKKPELQIEELRKIKEVLSRSNPFYTKNSEAFNKTMDSLNKVIKAQESLDKEANIRQLAELRSLYSELDENAAEYINAKEEKLKGGDERGNIRVNTIKTLRSITGKKHVEKMQTKLYEEQKKLDKQMKVLQPCKKLMDKWKDKDPTASPEARAAFKKDFDMLSQRLGNLKNDYGDMPYFKMGIAESLEKFTEKADLVKEQLDEKKLLEMKNLTRAGNKEMEKLYAMDGTINPVKKEKTLEQPIKEVEAPKKNKDPLIK